MASKSKKLLKVIDGIRAWNLTSSQSNSSKGVADIEETLKSEHLQIGKIVRHGFPYEPTCVAFDPIQHLLAVGTKHGSIRIFGRPGVDYHLKQPNNASVVQLIFLVNEGGLISICNDDAAHLWTIRQKQPDIVHTIQFKRERLTCGHLSFGSNWLYVGTERGNVYFVNVQKFMLSGYVINWNKAIDLSQATHPGPVVQLADNPQDPNKLLIGFASGFVALWDLRSKTVEARYRINELLFGLAWHYEGKQFMTCHSNGVLCTWNYRQPQKPVSMIQPHGTSTEKGIIKYKRDRETLSEEATPAFDSIRKVAWLSTKSGDPFVVFSGGNTMSSAPSPPCITIMRGKRRSVLQMDHTVLDFVCLCETPFLNDIEEPTAVVVLLQNDLVVIDLLTPNCSLSPGKTKKKRNYLTFENPYPMDIHESPVTCCHYLSDCPADLIPAFYSVGSRANRADRYSQREWPINGGEWGTSYCSYAEIIITGHADGSLRIWDASAVTLTALYKIHTCKFFERSHQSASTPASTPASANSETGSSTTSPANSASGDQAVDSAGTPGQKSTPADVTLNANVIPLNEEHPLAIHMIHMCPESRKLLAVSSTHIVLMAFNKREIVSEIPVLDVSVVYDTVDDYENADDTTKQVPLIQQSSHSSTASFGDKDLRVFIAVRPGLRKWSSGYQPELLLRLGTGDGKAPPPVASVALNSSLGLMAMGNDYGIAVIDTIQRTCLLSTGTPDLYGSMDPYTRVNRSPGTKKEDAKSPSVEQQCVVQQATTPPANSVHDTTGASSEGQSKSVPVTPTSTAPEVAAGHRIPPPRPPPPRPPPPVPSKSWEVVQHQEVIDIITSEEELMVEEPVDEAFDALAMFPEETNAGEQSDGDTVDGAGASRSLHEGDVGDSMFRKFSKKRKCRSVRVSATTHNSHTSDDPDSSTHATKPSTLGRLFRRAPSNQATPVAVANRVNHANSHIEVVDLTDDDRSGGQRVKLHILSPKLLAISPLAVVLSLKQKAEKSDVGPFSRSCSSSTSSLENITCEAVKTLVFVDSYGRKGDNTLSSCLWIGTSLGSVLVLNMNMPEGRTSQPVIVSPSGTIFRLRGEILEMAFLDFSGDLIAGLGEKWEDSSRPPASSSDASPSTQDRKGRRELRQGNSATGNAASGQNVGTITSQDSSASLSSSSGHDHADRQFAVLCSEKHARVVALPSQTCAFKAKITETSCVVNAQVVRLRGSPLLAVYLANGHIMALSLPSLRVLIDVDYLPLCERVGRTFCFGHNGHALFFCTPNEMEKLTLSTDMCNNLSDMQGELFIPCDMPEPPKKNFFQNFFNAGGSELDRDELFGEASGKASIATAAHVPNPKMDKLQLQAGGATSEIAKAKLAAIERGERLGQLDQQTQEMMDQAKMFSKNANALAAKYEKKDKRWGLPF